MNKSNDPDPRSVVSAERYQALVESVTDYAIFMLDASGHIISWNRGAQDIKGYAAEEIIGQHFSKFYPAEAVARNFPQSELKAAAADGRFEDEGWRVRKDGSQFWANVIITRMLDADGQLLGYSKVTRDLTERRQQESELRQSEERFRLLVAGVTEYAIMMLDVDGNVVSWNTGAERIKGYKATEIIGKHFSHFYTSEAILVNQPWQDLAAARVDGRVANEGWCVRKDGSLFWANTVVTALHDAEGGIYGYAKVTQDLTKSRQAEALATTTERLQEFIAMLAHELRNPLAPIRNAVALMGRKGLEDPLLESMRQTIDRQSLQLTRLLDELLDVNRIARGQFAIERKPVDLREVVVRAVESSRPLIDIHGHQLEIKSPDEAVCVSGDVVRLTQVVVNLLNNSARYTPDGGTIQLLVAARATEAQIRVIDSGKGIDPSMLEKVFDLFVQADATASDAIGGLGVGLALVRRVVELHGGMVHASSEGKGQGTEVIVHLPLSIEQVQSAPAADAGTDHALPQLRVLVIDDNADAADAMGSLMQAMGQQVNTVYDGAAGIRLVKTFHPHIVLLDIGMPYMSGYEVAKAIRTADAGPQPTLVAITGWGQDSDKVRAAAAGFDYHFVKPMSEGSIRDLLRQVAEKTGADRSGTTQT